MSRRVYRSSKDKIIAGVCGGLAEHFQVDPLVVRLGFIALAISSFYLGILAYAAAVILLPVGHGPVPGEVEVVHHPHEEKGGGPRRLLALIFIGTGTLLLLGNLLRHNRYFALFLSKAVSLWPLALIILGLALLLTKK
ncbi:MAG: PspC domain-containing protein [Firmicutes bacterium]|nr:PspC domain-containing protein [Bacillota bacterium]HOB34249.1 PspC domain-containing protein [Bacillota bacterium]HPZ89960.1 PspC domain-containing protein [Bacillota bacterium]HQE01366.1 PspC domain-containing protein [Bacillota bacterium]